MKILIMGLGVIGTIYAYSFQKAGHRIEHFVRPHKRNTTPKDIEINLLDGRTNKKGEELTDTYSVELSRDNDYDYILVSVSSGRLIGAIESLNEHHITGEIILFNGVWENRSQIDKMMDGRPYIMGYPVAGGRKEGESLEGVLFDHIMLESRTKSNIKNYDRLVGLFHESNIKVESPHDMVEWIWLHMAINTGVITTAAKYGDVNHPAEAARVLMGSAKALTEAIKSIREAVRIVEARGVVLKNYKKELLAYKIPAFIAARIMKIMFNNNPLTRRIMELHDNIDDLVFVCTSVFDEGVRQGVRTPLLQYNYSQFIKPLLDDSETLLYQLKSHHHL